MSAHHYRWVWSLQIRAMEKLVMLALAREANDEGKCTTTMAQISMDTGIDRRTIMRAIKGLEKCGFLKVNRTIGQESTYQLQVTARHKREVSEFSFFVSEGGNA